MLNLVYGWMSLCNVLSSISLVCREAISDFRR
jgi:hypothetical protein